jgi:hypothetical protein
LEIRNLLDLRRQNRPLFALKTEKEWGLRRICRNTFAFHRQYPKQSDASWVSKAPTFTNQTTGSWY